MAIAHVSQYDAVAKSLDRLGLPVGQEPAIAEEDIDFTSGEAKTASFLQSGCVMVRIDSDTDCRILFGTNPEAADDGTSKRVWANQPEYFGVREGGDLKISVIAQS